MDTNTLKSLKPNDPIQNVFTGEWGKFVAGWTYTSPDQKWSAPFNRMVIYTKGNPEALVVLPNNWEPYDGTLPFTFEVELL